MDEPEAPPAAPLVLAVVVAHDPGDWFEAALGSIAEQDYPNLSLLVIDAASSEPVADRVRAVAPGAQVERLDENLGYGVAANAALTHADEAAFLLLCHDDVRLDRDACRSLVEEAFRSNAGIVGPKMVAWDDPSHLLQVGLAIDRTGVPSPFVERGELDQQQHDSVRDVFAVPGGCILVRTDLHRALGGFDERIDYLGDDVDLCWRAHIAGARVLVVPRARVAHLEALGLRRPVDDRRRRAARHRLRSVLTCYSRGSRIRFVPQAFIIAVVEAVFALILGKGAQARDVLGAWTWNARRRRQLRAKRQTVAASRRVSDRELRHLQVRGSARLSSYLRGQIGQSDDRVPVVTGVSRQLAGSLRNREARAVVIVWIGVATLLVIGTRGLLFGSFPAVGQFALFPDHATDLVREWLSGWRSAGLGATAAQPTAYGSLGGLGYLFLGAMGTLREVVVLGMIPLGAFGMFRLLKPTGSHLARAVGLVTYVSIPVAYNAVASASWTGLVAYAVAPFLVAHLGRAIEASPFGPIGTDRDPAATGQGRTLVQRMLGLGLLLAVAALVLPAVLLLVLVIGVALTVGSVLAGQPEGSVRAVSVAAGGAAFAFVLQLPWSLDFADWGALVGVGPVGTGPLDVGELLRFETGPLGAAPLGWAFLVVAAFPLVVGRGWRLAWAIRGWTLALAGWAVLFVGQQGWLPVPLPAPEVVLAPAAVGLAMAAGIGVVAFRVDLVEYRFGWRQVLAGAAGLALVLGALPVVADAVVDGRWSLPERDFDRVLSVLDEEADDEGGGFRLLWIGDPSVLPLGGWELEDGVAYATSDGGPPTVQDLWAGPPRGATERLGDAVREAAAGNTNRLGSLLGPMGVRYVVVPESLAPDAEESAPIPESLEVALDEQLDLIERPLGSSRLVVYENAAWVPTPAQAPDESLVDAAPVLRADGLDSYSGPVEDSGIVYQASSADGGWKLAIDGEPAEREVARGWANAFTVDEGGDATLSYDTALLRRLALLIQMIAWLAVIVLVIRAGASPETEVEP